MLCNVLIMALHNRTSAQGASIGRHSSLNNEQGNFDEAVLGAPEGVNPVDRSLYNILVERTSSSYCMHTAHPIGDSQHRAAVWQ